MTRKYPPGVGGMERLAEQIVSTLRKRGPLVLIRWRRSQAGLPLFVLWAAIRIVCGLARGTISVLYLGDPVLLVLGTLARRRGVPVLVTVHGLDVLYPGRIYQSYLRHFFWERCDGYVCISRFVADVLQERGISRNRIHVLPLGIDLARASVPTAPLRRDGPMLVMLGRLGPRKGIAWFVDEVAPRLLRRHSTATLVIAGDGPERSRIAGIIERNDLSRNVELLGRVDDECKNRLLAECDAVVMPNVPIPGDAEGFGLVALEAGAAAKAIFAADLEGLRDAIRPGENGWLLPAGDAAAWIEALDRALADRQALAAAGQRAHQCVLAHYDWATVGERYADTIAAFAHQ